MTSKKIVLQPLDSHEFIYTLRSFKNLLASCVGPGGGIKILITAAGHDTYTSSSYRLLSNIVLDDPICTYINQIIKSQLSVYNDHGHYCGILISSLLESALSQRNGIPLSTVTSILEHLGSEVNSILETDCIKMKIDFSTVKHLLPLVESVISSKPMCGLTKAEIESLELGITKAFIQTIGKTVGNVIVECSEGIEQENKVIPGILYQICNEDTSLLEEKCNKSGLSLLLFNIMLTDENEANISENRAVKLEKNVLKKPFIQQTQELFEEVLKLNVDIIACQKVVHPALMQFLQRKDILVLERLGTESTIGLEKLSGATPISTISHLTETELNAFIGRIDTVRHIKYGQKQWASLEKENGNISTLLAHAPTDEAATELKVVIKQALSTLTCLLTLPEVVPGAGCFEMSLAVRLLKQVELKLDQSIHNTKHLEKCISWLQMAFLTAAGFSVPDSLLMVDSLFGHAWKSDRKDCCCSLVSADTVKSYKSGRWIEVFNNNGPLLLQNSNIFKEISSDSLGIKEHARLDLYKSKANAIRLSLESCINLLGIGMVVYKPPVD